MRAVSVFITIITMVLPLFSDVDTSLIKDKRKRINFVLVPIIYFEPETGLGAGGNASCYFKLDHALRPSMLGLEISGTQRKQFIGTLESELYPGNLKWYSSLASKVQRYPDFFYGIGNSTLPSAKTEFLQHLAEFTITGQRFVCPLLRLGGMAWMRYDRISVKNRNSFPGTAMIPEKSQYSFFSFGPRCTYDSRNSIYLTNKGIYADLQFYGAISDILSDYSFCKLKIDSRYFFTFGKKQTVGIQAVAILSAGELPFQVLPGIGDVLRGYAENRYRDRHIIALQTEYSFDIWKRLRGEIFAGFGDVYSHPGDISLNRLKIAGGAGLKYVFTDDGVSFRVDYGYSRRDGGQLYITAKDAF